MGMIVVMKRDETSIAQMIERLGKTKLAEIDECRSISGDEAVKALLSDEFDARPTLRAHIPERVLAPNQPIRSLRELGMLLRARRRQLGYTQEELADSLGCSARLIRETEQGRPTVGFERVLGHATVLGIDLFARVRGGDFQ